MIDLNHCEATRPCSSALERMRDPVEEADLTGRRQMIYDLVGAPPDAQFVFTSSGAEAINQVLWSVFLLASRKEGKCHFATSYFEDAPTLQMLKRLEELGCYVKIAPLTKRGQIDVDQLVSLINPRTALLSLSMAQGLTGVIQPFEEVAKLAKEKKILLHLDATYAAGKFPFSMADLEVDYLTFSGDRIHSVIGSGALFAKKGAPLIPLILGGSGLRGGTFDVFSFLAFCAAAQQASLYLDAMNVEVARLRDLLEKEIASRLPEIEILFSDVLRLPNTTAIRFPRVHQEALLYFLHRKGVRASIGGTYGPHLHRLLTASGWEERDAQSSVSFSLSRMTTEAEIRRAAVLIAEATKYLQTLSEDLFNA